jgi:hypothetical protein
MSFDSSRFTFDPWNNFSGVVMEQGRVQLDSEWNEWLAELNRRIRAGTLDILGRAAVPRTTPDGFKITLGPAPGNAVLIGPGRMYVDGLLAENHGRPAPSPEKWIPTGGAAERIRPLAGPAIELLRRPLWDPALDELVGPESVPYNRQPYFPNAGAAAPFPRSAGPFLVYLDVWQRAVTFLEDPELVEKAVGVDTTGRLQTVWQVKWLDVSDVAGVTCSTPDDDIPAWTKLRLPPGPRLTTGVVQTAPSGPCCLTANAGYTGLENQLYRVEIHQPGKAIAGGSATPVSNVPAGTATFKWSRDNASVATAVTAISPDLKVLTVVSTGKDDVLRFSPNDWVEVTDDWLELAGLPGELHQIADVSDAARTVTLATAVASASFPVDANGQTDSTRHTRLVRWDQGGKVYEADGTTVWVDLDAAGSTGDIPVPPPGASLILESGITVTFELAAHATAFQTGNYWDVAARASDGTIEYLDGAPPRGIYHHYARLAVVTMPAAEAAAGTTGKVEDCRTPWPPDLGQGCDCGCTVFFQPGDLTTQKGLQPLVDGYQNLAGPTVFCLAAGTYALPAPLRLTAAHNNLTFQACQAGTVVIQAQSGKENGFADGLIVLDGASNVAFRGLTFQSPLAHFAPARSQFAGLPVEALPGDVQSAIKNLYVAIGLRPVNCAGLTVDNCEFAVGGDERVNRAALSEGSVSFAADIFAGGACSGFAITGSRFRGGTTFGTGFLLTPTVSFNRPVHFVPGSPLLGEGELAGATPAAVATSPGLAAAGGQVVPAALSDARFEDNTFAALSVACLILGASETIDFVENHLANRGAGFWLVEPLSAPELALDQLNPAIVGGAALAYGYPLPAGGSTQPEKVAAVPAPVQIFTGAAAYTDGQGNVWTPDAKAKAVTIPDGTLFHPNPPPTISGTSDQPLYQSERWGNCTYTFTNLAVGYYTVTLKFAEIVWSKAKIRIFDVLINGVTVLKDFDIFADVGRNQANDKTFVNIPAVNGQIAVQFVGNPSATDSNPKISAIAVEPQWTGRVPLFGQLSEFQRFLAQLAILGAQGYANQSPPALYARIADNEMRGLSAPAVLVLGDDQVASATAGSLTLTANRLASRIAYSQRENALEFLFGSTGTVAGVTRCVVTGNQILNEATNADRLSFLLNDLNLPAAEIAVMSNVFQGRLVVFPNRYAANDPNAPPFPMNGWDFLNTVVR